MPVRACAVVLTAVLVVSGFAAIGGGAGAQLVAGVAARVNGEAITETELQQRTRLALIAAKLGDTAENRQRARPAILDQLVLQRLRLGEAGRQGVSVSVAEIEKLVADIELSEGLQPGQWRQTLLAAGIDPSIAEYQLRANAAWTKLLDRHLDLEGGAVQREFDTASGRLTSAAEQRRYRIAELVLLAAPADSATQGMASWLLEKVRSGAPFAVTAFHFSRAASAVRGGDIGCLPAALMERQIVEAIGRLGDRAVPEPIRVDEEWSILHVQSSSSGVCSHEIDEPRVHVVELILPLARDAPLDEVERRAAEARALMADVKTCGDLRAAGRRTAGAATRDIQSLAPAQLPRHMRNALEDLPVGSGVGPFRLPDAVQILAICARSGSTDPFAREAEMKAGLRALAIRRVDRTSLQALRTAASIQIADSVGR